MEQITFDHYTKERFVINKPVRLIEIFAGIGAQAKALERLGIEFEHYRICEFDKYAVTSYNAIHGTEFEPSDVKELKGADLGIVETDRYIYILTYSFPCTDLSKAGKQKGMKKDSDTRSGLLWEVERLLNETKELPQVLLMENVPQVHGADNIEDFSEWISFLESKGYTSYYEDLNAKDYRIPQNRDRCFMVSLLGNYYYVFPERVELKETLGDRLESEVDEKYYLSDEQVEKLLSSTYNHEKARIQGGYKERYSPEIIKPRHVSQTIRSGGRGSSDRHRWDVVCDEQNDNGRSAE